MNTVDIAKECLFLGRLGNTDKKGGDVVNATAKVRSLICCTVKRGDRNLKTDDIASNACSTSLRGCDRVNGRLSDVDIETLSRPVNVDLLEEISTGTSYGILNAALLFSQGWLNENLNELEELTDHHLVKFLNQAEIVNNLLYVGREPFTMPNNIPKNFPFLSASKRDILRGYLVRRGVLV